MKWRVTKKVTEYHYFIIEADSKQEALDMAEDNDTYYCDSDKANDLIVYVASCRRVRSEEE